VSREELEDNFFQETEAFFPRAFYNTGYGFSCTYQDKLKAGLEKERESLGD